MVRLELKVLIFLFFTFFFDCGAVSVSTLPGGNLAVGISLDSYNTSNIEDQAFTQLISLKADTKTFINVVNIPKTVNFIVVQIHSYLYNVSIAYDVLINKPGNTVTGTNIGLFYETAGSLAVSAYVFNANPLDVDGLIAVVAYANTAPYPGGCNMEFDVEKSPFQKLMYNEATVTVDAQPASVPKIGTVEPLCEKYPLRHDAYRMYMPEKDFSNETYFKAIASMLTVQDIQNNAVLIPEPLFGSAMRRVYSAYPGVGSVYGMVAHFANYTSAYVPIVSYSCDPNTPDTCTHLTTSFPKVLCAIAFFLGIFVAMRGYHYFKTSMFLISMVAGSCTGYTLGVYASTLDSTGIFTMAMITGVLTSLIWFLFWTTVTSPIPSLMLSGVTLGSFFFFVFYYFTPGGIFYLEFDPYFWMLYVLFVTLTIFLFSVIPTTGNILCFTMLGAYATVFAIDYYTGSNLKYIIINAIRRATVPDFNIAVIQPPYQEIDALLTVFWVFIVILGLCKQYASSQERAPFPPSVFVNKNERTPLMLGDNRKLPPRRKPFFNRGPQRYTQIDF